jgi:hypothetical protein
MVAARSSGPAGARESSTVTISDESCLHPEPIAIHLEAERRLGSGAYAAIRDLRCRFEVGVLRLEGSLPSYYLKQVALVLVADLEGVHHIEDAIRVERN